jgi:hypothetical protein
VFDGNHRTATMTTLAEKGIGNWMSTSVVPVIAHSKELPDSAAVRLSGLVNEVQVVAKGGSYGDQLSYLHKTMERAVQAVTKTMEANPVALTVEEAAGKKPSRQRTILEAKAKKVLKDKRSQVENYVLDYFLGGASQLTMKLNESEVKEFRLRFDLTFVKAKLAMAEFLGRLGIDALCALERVSLVTVRQAWDLMVPESAWAIQELSKAEKVNLFPQATNAVKKLNTSVQQLVAKAPALFGIPLAKETPTEVAQLPLLVVRNTGLRILTWHLAYHSQRFFKRRGQDAGRGGLDQYSLSKNLVELYFDTIAESDSVQVAVTKTLDEFWQAMAVLFKLFTAKYPWPSASERKEMEVAAGEEPSDQECGVKMRMTKAMLQVADAYDVALIPIFYVHRRSPNLHQL